MIKRILSDIIIIPQLCIIVCLIFILSILFDFMTWQENLTKCDELEF